MSFWSDVWQSFVEYNREKLQGLENIPAEVGSVAGAAAGASPSPAPGPKMRNPTVPNETPGQAALRQLKAGPAVAPGEAIKQSAQAVVGAGPLAGSYRTVVVWAIIIVIVLIGVWGLIAPGGGVALIERKISKR